ncbi:helix-turn-helix domain-containing protein [Glycomyces artemisiae]|nr:helix-turn-helix domain-containing protein [Glycomyces artemisiae]
MANYTAAQAAERFRVHRTTVLSWRNRGWCDPDTGKHRTLSPALDPVTGTPLKDPKTGALLFPESELVLAEQQTRAQHRRSHRRSRALVSARI